MIVSLFLYLSVFILSSILSFLSIKRKNVLFAFVAILLPTLLVGLRLGVGTDYDAYVYMYNTFVDMDYSDFVKVTDETKIEVGFFLIIKLAAALTADPWGMFLISSATTISIAYWAIKKIAKEHTPRAYLLYLLFVVPFTMNGVRQGIAMSLVFLAISYMISGNKIKYVASILAASLFHSSALILLPLYFLRTLTRSKSTYSLTSLVKAMLPALFVAVTIPAILLLGSAIPVVNQYLSYSGSSVGIGVTTMSVKLVLVIVIAISFHKVLNRDKSAIILISLILLEIVCVGLGFVSGVFARLQYYLIIGGLLYLAELPEVFSKNGSSRLVQALTLFYGVSYFIIAYYLAGYSGVFPYNSILGVLA